MTLEDTDRIFQCPFCRVRLAFQATPHFTYVLPAKNPRPLRPLTYVPYWRFRGFTFVWDTQELHHRILDVSAAAVTLCGVPSSLGLRPQAMPMSFYTPMIPGTFLQPQLSWQGFLKSIGLGLKGRLKEPASRMTYHAFIGESVSLIYAPFFEQQGMMHDAVTGQALKPWPEELSRAVEDTNPESRLHFLPTLCPRCGGDMEGERDALVLRCQTCSEFWEMTGCEWHALEVAWIPGDPQETVWAPFWVLDVAAQGFSLETFEDFLTLTRAPIVGMAKKAETPFHFWIPAFKIAPQFFLRAARAATVHQPDTMTEQAVPFKALYPVTLPSVEAFQACPILLGALSPSKEELLPRIRQGRLAFQRKRLAYVPLRRLSSEWLMEPFGIALPMHALRWGRTL